MARTTAATAAAMARFESDEEMRAFYRELNRRSHAARIAREDPEMRRQFYKELGRKAGLASAAARRARSGG